MSETPLIPIATAKRLGKQYEKQQVIIIGLDRERARSTLTTWGKDRAHCKEIADVGEWLMAHFEKMLAGKGEPITRTIPDMERAVVDAAVVWARTESLGPSSRALAEAVRALIEARGESK